MSFRGKSILVTGGAGFIGSHLVDRLIEEQPGQIAVVDNLSIGKRDNLSFSVPLYVKDASDMISMEKIVNHVQPDIVFSLATTPLPQSLKDPAWCTKTIFGLASVVCELAREYRFKLVHVSTSEVYGEGQYFPMDEKHPFGEKSPYAAAKAAADLLVGAYEATFGIEAVIVRPFNTYGPRQNMGMYAAVIPETLRRIFVEKIPPVVTGDGLQERDFSYVVDVARAIVEIAKRNEFAGQTVNVASGVSTSINDLMGMLCELTGYSGEIERGHFRAADVRKHRGDTSKLDSIGFKPMWLLEAGLKETVKWYKEHFGSRD